MSRDSLPELVDASRPFNPGLLIGDKYRLQRRLGEGAMGTIWVAHNELLDVDVAIKLMRCDNPRADPALMYQRLLQEARAAARLGHPAIVRIFDFGRSVDGAPFIVMELLEGEPLSEFMDREGPIEPTRAVQMILPIADALGTAHGRGIVHRDVKPENIFIARDEYDRLQPKIVDFGVARFSEGGRTLTNSGALMGTPDYMAPEQAQGASDIDHRADVWALCVVLYELIAGRRPFGGEGANYLAVLRAIVEEPPTVLTDLGVGDKGLWMILERGLKKRLPQRWDTMRVLGEALALWLYERGIKEDAYGASLKTTWLQSGIDGVKIDTPSMAPPEGPGVASERETLPGSEEVAAVTKGGRDSAAVRRGWMLVVVAALAFVASLTALGIVLSRPTIEPPGRPSSAHDTTPQEPAPVAPERPIPAQKPVIETDLDLDSVEVTETEDAGLAAPTLDAATPQKLRSRRSESRKSGSGSLPQPGSFDFGF